MGRKHFFIFTLLLSCFIIISNPLFAGGEVAGESSEASIDEWVERAEKHLLNGEDEKALSCYQQVLLLDSKNLSANIFMGNYYYVQVERVRKSLEIGQTKKNKATNEEKSKYREALIDLWPTYAKAKNHLEVVLSQFPSSEVIKTLNHIEELHKIIQ